jgi:hypothetical protein
LKESSLKGFQIHWYKKAKLSKAQKIQIKKSITDMSDTILQSMDCAKKEASEDPAFEVRLPLPFLASPQAYLTVEYCNDAWHLLLETVSDCIGELVCVDFPCIQMLKSNEIEEEALL